MNKISFICAVGLDNFIDPIIAGLSNNYIVRKFIVKTQQEIYNAIDWGDVIWLEWANEVAIIATNYERIKGKKVVVRLHRYEAFTDSPKQINWSVVNRLILVAPHMKGILKETIPDIEEKVKIKVVYNGLDLDKIPFKERGTGFNIALVGYINHRKNPTIALQIMKQLVDRDKRYILHIAGSFQDRCLQDYLMYMIDEMGLQDNIKYYGWVDDMEGFWKDKNYLLHTSIHEAHSYVTFEALSRGIKLIIHNFRGSKELYPEDTVFNTINEAVDKISTRCYNSSKYRDWVFNKDWTLKNQLNQIRRIIEEL